MQHWNVLIIVQQLYTVTHCHTYTCVASKIVKSTCRRKEGREKRGGGGKRGREGREGRGRETETVERGRLVVHLMQGASCHKLHDDGQFGWGLAGSHQQHHVGVTQTVHDKHLATKRLHRGGGHLTRREQLRRRRRRRRGRRRGDIIVTHVLWFYMYIAQCACIYMYM